MFDQDHHDDAPRVAAAGAIDPQQRQWAMFAHLSALLGGLLTTAWGGSIGCFIGPLVIWLLKKDAMPFVGDQAKEALNFNITVAIIFLVLFLMTLFTLGIGIIITGPLFVVVGLSWLVFTIIAAIRANDGIAYRYPLTLRLIK